jgi:hypothetical protein
MAPAFNQPDVSARAGATSVWAAPDNASLLFVKGLNVNTDGTRRSYKVDDFWGQREALNNLCNAMSDACAGLSTSQLKERRLATERAASNGWPGNMLKATRISDQIIAIKDGKPCTSADGFLVSKTALAKRNVADVCDLSNYVDALVTPALVLPQDRSSNNPSGFSKRNAKVGDLAVVMVPGGAAPVFAVVGDTGPANKLGEGSIALNGKLLGKTEPPVNYLEVRGQGKFAGRAWTVPKAIVLVFPATRDKADPLMTPERIDAAARERFAQWGGAERMKACATAYGL